MKKIEVVFSEDGSVKVDALGYVGADCVKATEFVHRALGKVESSSKKPEFYKKQPNQAIK